MQNLFCRNYKHTKKWYCIQWFKKIEILYFLKVKLAVEYAKIDRIGSLDASFQRVQILLWKISHFKISEKSKKKKKKKMKTNKFLWFFFQKSSLV